jgi:DNA-binding PadR family transcriptional regulator
MSLPHALLTSLIERPSSGLELAGRFERSIGYFWQATHQQIYRELGRMEDAGWVESVAAEGRGGKRSYLVLPAGREELRRWVEESSDPRPLRDEMMVRLRAEAAIGPTGLADELKRRLELHRQKLAVYEAIAVRDFSAPELSREQKLQALVLKTGIEMESLSVRVAEEALGILAGG